jgi:hypothetical protein
MQPLRFGRLAAARAHADRLSPKAARVVVVERSD